MRNHSSQTNVLLLWKSQISCAHWPKTKHASRNSTTARACQTDSNRLRDRVFLLAVSHAGLKISPWRRFLLKLLRARESDDRALAFCAFEVYAYSFLKEETLCRFRFWFRFSLDFVVFLLFPLFLQKTSNTKKGSNTDIEITLYIYQYTYTYTY